MPYAKCLIDTGVSRKHYVLAGALPLNEMKQVSQETH